MYAPLDCLLGISAVDVLSPELEKDFAYIGALLPYREVVEVVKRLKGDSVSHVTIQRCTNDVGELAQKVALRPLKNHPDKKHLSFQADGGRINTYEGWRETKTCIIENGFDLIQRTTIDNHTNFMSEFCCEIKKQGYDTDPVIKALLSDGAKWIGDDFGQYFPSVVQILDYYHFKEHLHEAAKILFGEKDQAINEKWVKKHLKYCFDDKISTLILRLKQQKLECKPKSAKHEALRQLLGYVENNKHRISYSKYQQMGLPIGSGKVEATIKKMNNSKMKSGSIRWQLANAKKVLALRTLIYNQQFNNIKFA